MSDPSFTGRTTNIALKYGVHDTENFNWNRIDDVVGNAFTPDSPLQIPDGAIDGSKIAPGSIASDLIFVSGTLYNSLFGLATAEHFLTLSNGQQALLTQDMIETRYGPVLITGNIPIQIQNATAGAVQFTLDLHALIYGVYVPIISPSLQWSAAPNATATVFIPLSTFIDCAGNFSGNFSGTLIQLIAQKDSGPDTIVVTCRSGIVSLTEFA
jgi:hypothetical protein